MPSDNSGCHWPGCDNPRKARSAYCLAHQVDKGHVKTLVGPVRRKVRSLLPWWKLWRCSECNGTTHYRFVNSPNYCPYCGVKRGMYRVE
jgi:rubrerythrin